MHVLKHQFTPTQVACWETIEMSHSDTDSEKSGSDLESEQEDGPPPTKTGNCMELQVPN